MCSGNSKPNFETDIMVCKCNSTEHQLVIMIDREYKEVSIDVHLCNHDNFFKRLWTGLKYAFGYQCKYGAFDSVILDNNNYRPLKNAIDYLDGVSSCKCKPSPPKGQVIKEDGTDLTKDVSVVYTGLNNTIIV